MTFFNEGYFLLLMECVYLCFGLRNNLLNFYNGLLFPTVQSIGFIVIFAYLDLMSIIYKVFILKLRHLQIKI